MDKVTSDGLPTGSERENHCKDCCCARSWDALGITTYTGLSIPEHIEALREENERLRTTLSVKREPASAVMFLLRQGGKVLVERCPKKRAHFGAEWFIPGGRVEFGETCDETLRREMQEELGCEPVVVRWCGYVDRTAEGFPLFLMRVAVVEEWAGQVPDATLDHGSPLEWHPVRDVALSPVSGIRAALAVAFPLAASPPEAEKGDESTYREAMETIRRSTLHVGVAAPPEAEPRITEDWLYQRFPWLTVNMMVGREDAIGVYREVADALCSSAPPEASEEPGEVPGKCVRCDGTGLDPIQDARLPKYCRECNGAGKHLFHVDELLGPVPPVEPEGDEKP